VAFLYLAGESAFCGWLFYQVLFLDVCVFNEPNKLIIIGEFTGSIILSVFAIALVAYTFIQLSNPGHRRASASHR
jgi:hypothetical protein